jgi:hypothetical protein
MMIAQDFDAPFSSLCDERRLCFERLIEGADFDFEMLLYCAPRHRRIVRGGEAQNLYRLRQRR